VGGVEQWQQILAAANNIGVWNTNDCKWITAGQLEFEHLQASGTIPCGFGIRDQQWKLILGWGGGPDTWCNKTSEGLMCKDFVEQPEPTSPVETCDERVGLCLPHNDITNFNANSSAECCNACSSTEGCVAYTFNLNGGTEKVPKCYLKNDVPSKATSDNDCTSATFSVPFPPAPSPTPTPSQACVNTSFCLWDVVADPGEHTEVSAQHPGVVSELKVKMAEVLTSFSQYQIDPSCGPATFEHDDVVGSAWAPWCEPSAHIEV